MFKRTYLIHSTTDKLDGTQNKNWTIAQLSVFTNLVHYTNQYRHEQENEHGGVCMIDSIRRV